QRSVQPRSGDRAPPAFWGASRATARSRHQLSSVHRVAHERVASPPFVIALIPYEPRSPCPFECAIVGFAKQLQRRTIKIDQPMVCSALLKQWRAVLISIWFDAADDGD